MTIRNLLVAYDGGPSADAALHMAALMARKYDAHLTGILAHGSAETYKYMDRWLTDDVRAAIEANEKDAIRETEERFWAQAKKEDIADNVEFLRVNGRADILVSEFSKYYDYTIIGRFNPVADDARLILHPDRIALKSGRPILVVPPDFSGKALCEHAIVAWDGGRSSARALADAIPILETKSLVSLVSVGKRYDPEPGRDIVEHLRRHEIDTELVFLPREVTVGTTLIRYAEQRAPDMLVMGAYEHSKFREDFFGGATDTVLRQSKVPVLISH